MNTQKDFRSTQELQAVTSESRLPACSLVYYRAEPHGRRDREYLRELAEGAGLGELFVATSRPLPRGTILALRIEPPSRGDSPLRARAVVCWRRRWGKPRGMQIKFFEIEGLAAARPERSVSPLPAALPAFA